MNALTRPDPSDPNEIFAFAERVVLRHFSNLWGQVGRAGETFCIFADESIAFFEQDAFLPRDWHMRGTMRERDLASPQTMMHALIESVAVLQRAGKKWTARVPGFGYKAQNSDPNLALADAVAFFIDWMRGQNGTETRISPRRIAQPVDPMNIDGVYALAVKTVREQHQTLKGHLSQRTMCVFADGRTRFKKPSEKISEWHMHVKINKKNMASPRSMAVALFASIAFARRRGDLWFASIPGLGYETAKSDEESAKVAIAEAVIDLTRIMATSDLSERRTR